MYGKDMYTRKLNLLSVTYTHYILLVIQILDILYWLNNYRVINESSTHLSPVICTCTVIVSKSICVRKLELYQYHCTLIYIFLSTVPDYFDHYLTWEKALAEKKGFETLVLSYEELKKVTSIYPRIFLY